MPFHIFICPPNFGTLPTNNARKMQNFLLCIATSSLGSLGVFVKTLRGICVFTKPQEKN
jgi:hypothetical protein